VIDEKGGRVQEEREVSDLATRARAHRSSLLFVSHNVNLVGFVNFAASLHCLLDRLERRGGGERDSAEEGWGGVTLIFCLSDRSGFSAKVFA
jgi:hypothetical protein